MASAPDDDEPAADQTLPAALLAHAKKRYIEMARSGDIQLQVSKKVVKTMFPIFSPLRT